MSALGSTEYIQKRASEYLLQVEKMLSAFSPLYSHRDSEAHVELVGFEMQREQNTRDSSGSSAMP
jgi:hypothetical protein